MLKFKVKICGMTQANNIASVAELQPDYLGFIFYPKSPRYISEISRELIKYVPSSIKTTGVFVDEDLEVVRQIIAKNNLKAVQLHGSEDVAFCKAVKSTGVEVIKAFGIDENFDFAKLNAYENEIDFYLFDTQTVTHGGSGKAFDWKLLANYKLNKPYFLSGGLAIQHLDEIKCIIDERLYAIDVNSKFELEPGLKDTKKLKKFFDTLYSRTSLPS